MTLVKRKLLSGVQVAGYVFLALLTVLLPLRIYTMWEFQKSRAEKAEESLVSIGAQEPVDRVISSEQMKRLVNLLIKNKTEIGSPPIFYDQKSDESGRYAGLFADALQTAIGKPPNFAGAVPKRTDFGILVGMPDTENPPKQARKMEEILEASGFHVGRTTSHIFVPMSGYVYDVFICPDRIGS